MASSTYIQRALGPVGSWAIRNRAVSAGDGVSQSNGVASGRVLESSRMRRCVSACSVSGRPNAAASDGYVISSCLLLSVEADCVGDKGSYVGPMPPDVTTKS